MKRINLSKGNNYGITQKKNTPQHLYTPKDKEILIGVLWKQAAMMWS